MDHCPSCSHGDVDFSSTAFKAIVSSVWGGRGLRLRTPAGLMHRCSALPTAPTPAVPPLLAPQTGFDWVSSSSLHWQDQQCAGLAAAAAGAAGALLLSLCPLASHTPSCSCSPFLAAWQDRKEIEWEWADCDGGDSQQERKKRERERQEREEAERKARQERERKERQQKKEQQEAEAEREQRRKEEAEAAARAQAERKEAERRQRAEQAQQEQAQAAPAAPSPASAPDAITAAAAASAEAAAAAPARRVTDWVLACEPGRRRCTNLHLAALGFQCMTWDDGAWWVGGLAAGRERGAIAECWRPRCSPAGAAAASTPCAAAALISPRPSAHCSCQTGTGQRCRAIDSVPDDGQPPEGWLGREMVELPQLPEPQPGAQPARQPQPELVESPPQEAATGGAAATPAAPSPTPAVARRLASWRRR